MLFLEKLITHYQGSVGPKPWNQLKQVKEKLIKNFHFMFKEEDKEFLTKACAYIVADFIDGYVSKEGNYYKLSSTFSKHLYQSDVDFYGKSLVEDMSRRSILVELPYALSIEGREATSFFARFIETDKGVSLVCKAILSGDKVRDVKDLLLANRGLKRSPFCFYTETFSYDEKGFLKLEGKDDNSLFLLKCLIYIFSANPDLSPEKKEPRVLEKKDNVIYFPKKDENPFDIINVGYSFHERHYSVIDTIVDGHFRMQPCGPGRREVKKIWIDSHKRHYGKQKTA